MTHSAHTPGPWDNDGQFIVASDTNGMQPDIYIAEIVETDAEGRTAMPEQQTANARLIATAPEMLDALEEAEFALRNAADQYATDKGCRSVMLDGRLGIVCVAIANAKGGSP